MQFKILKEEHLAELDLQELTNSLSVGFLFFIYLFFLDLLSCSSSSTELGRWSMALWHYQLLCVQGPVAQRLSTLASCLLRSNKSQLVRCTEDICPRLWETSLFCIWNFFCIWNLSVPQVVRKSMLYIVLRAGGGYRVWLPGCPTEYKFWASLKYLGYHILNYFLIFFKAGSCSLLFTSQ